VRGFRLSRVALGQRRGTNLVPIFFATATAGSAGAMRVPLFAQRGTPARTAPSHGKRLSSGFANRRHARVLYQPSFVEFVDSLTLRVDRCDAIVEDISVQRWLGNVDEVVRRCARQDRKGRQQGLRSYRGPLDGWHQFAVLGPSQVVREEIVPIVVRVMTLDAKESDVQVLEAHGIKTLIDRSGPV
jgi:hypothetical protein